jgi:hypothetical protein
MWTIKKEKGAKKATGKIGSDRKKKNITLSEMTS